MRTITYPLIAISSLMLIVFSGLSIIGAILIGAGALLMLAAEWRGRKQTGILGFFVFAFGAATTDLPLGLATALEIISVGFLLVLPLSATLMFVITIDSQQKGAQRMIVAPIARSAIFASVVIASVPLTGYFVFSSRLATDVGVESEIMILGFATAIMSIIMMGRDSDKK